MATASDLEGLQGRTTYKVYACPLLSPYTLTVPAKLQDLRRSPSFNEIVYRPVRIMLRCPKSNRSHFGLPPSFIYKMTGRVTILCELLHIRTRLIVYVARCCVTSTCPVSAIWAGPGCCSVSPSKTNTCSIHVVTKRCTLDSLRTKTTREPMQAMNSSIYLYFVAVLVHS